MWGKKIIEACEEEMERETSAILNTIGQADAPDLEAEEFFVRSRLREAGARILQKRLEAFGKGKTNEPLVCAENHLACRMVSRGQREITIHTILGPVVFKRSVFVCPQCGRTICPADKKLSLDQSGYSPGMRRMLSRVAAENSFDTSCDLLKLCAGLEVSAKSVERLAEKTGRDMDLWMCRRGSAALLYGAPSLAPEETLYVSFDGTGVPMRGVELKETHGKDGKAKTREAKLGCVFTQTHQDAEGRPLRDPHSTTYVGAIESSVDFGVRIHAESVRRGLNSARRVVVLTDGAKYNKTITAEYFPQAIHIIDMYHAREHLSNFIKTLQSACPVELHERLSQLLCEGRVEELVLSMRNALPRSGSKRKEAGKEIPYFEENASRMRYAQYRSLGLFVGSGVIEAGCKTQVGQRLKKSGMFWTVKGANAIIALRNCIASGDFEQYWEDAA